jgi:hypothetical protein
MCCENPQCLSFVHGIAPGCDKTAPEDPDAVCCWIKTASTQLTVRKTASFFECFPYVCPEPVLAK